METTMNSADFTMAKMRHQSWRLRLRSHLDGKEKIDISEAVSPRDCALGKWLYAEGMTKYGALAEMRTLEKVHANMHGLVKRIIELDASGKKDDARQEFEKIGPMSEKILELLTALEKQVVAAH
jgi:methyl-accepting chemotaxis protein